MKEVRPTSGNARKSDGRLAAKKAPEKRKTGSRKAKDPNKPKRPPSAFFVFMDQFRKEFKEKNPENKLVSVVGKAGGNKWKSMSDAEKAPYVAKAGKLKDEYLKKIRFYDGSDVEKKNAAEDESSDKSKSEVSEEGAESDGEEEDD
ncbi:HMG1/2-like protein [Dendrobium catenatum]|uniref:High mobility group B protein 4 n=1 Tax=Dendrobium catenatum TaxID=906689 RepID=A0A2I0VIU3_9ASPA|nr:HMG1/2-like protein [Dendrobium catenatum]PKU63337.1 High mobility group B protein 4 [Dendrobium catenatum]